MTDTTRLNGYAIVAQSGGPTAAINATLSGVIRGAFDNYEYVRGIYGARYGISGVINDDLVKITKLSDKEHFLLESTPSSALGSCRLKLPDPDGDDVDIYEKIFSVFAKYNIRYFYYIGGNDSMDTVAKLSVYAQKIDYSIKLMGVPKTIDNDLMGTDHTPGFGSAAKYVATTMQEIARDCTVYTVKAVTIVEIMGRDAGWLTAAAGLPRLFGERTADLIYLPEVPFDADLFIEKIKELQKIRPDIVVAVSEGIKNANGKYVSEGTSSDAVDIFGHKYIAGAARALEQLVKEKIGCKVRAVELNLPQRCAAHLQSKTDIDESVLIGKKAVDYSLTAENMQGLLSVFRRLPDVNYQVKIQTAFVRDIANKVSSVPLKYIEKDGTNVTDELLEYILPLIQGEINIPTENGLPVHFEF